MKRPNATFCLLALFACAPLAGHAQSIGDTGGGASGPSAPQPRARVPDFAPPAVPGANGATLSTMPPVPKVDTGDPTTELFTAINSGDYNGAQDAVGRGADMNAQNDLGETPLDLSIALNRNSITFMLLSARDESGGDSAGPTAMAAPAGAMPARKSRFHPIPARMVAPSPPQPMPSQMPGDNPGTPNTAAGFLGFGQH